MREEMLFEISSAPLSEVSCVQCECKSVS